METKMTTIHFDVKKAKRIQAGEAPGKIITKDGKDVKVVCWDLKTYLGDRILVITTDDMGYSHHVEYFLDGRRCENRDSDCDLMLLVPDWTLYVGGMDTPQAQEYLNEFFGYSSTSKYKFEFLQPVLVRSSKSEVWKYGKYTHTVNMQANNICFTSGGLGWHICIPYNEETKHLLGTTDNWEEKK